MLLVNNFRLEVALAKSMKFLGSAAYHDGRKHGYS